MAMLALAGAVIAFLLVPFAGQAAEIEFGRYHALVIGNNAYRELPRLGTAVNDAEAVAKLLESRYGFEVRLLRDATKRDILRAVPPSGTSCAPSTATAPSSPSATTW
jgi:hypothetical protein